MCDVDFDEWYDDWYDQIDVSYNKSEPNSIAFSQIIEAYEESKEERTQNE